MSEDVLRARIAALESQVATLTAIDEEAHRVYRDAAVMLSTYVAGARGSSDLDRRRQVERMWGELADAVDRELAKEQVH